MFETELQPDHFAKYLQQNIDREIERMIDEEMKLLKERVEARKAEIVAGVLLHVQKEISIQTMSQQIVVTIKNAS